VGEGSENIRVVERDVSRPAYASDYDYMTPHPDTAPTLLALGEDRSQVECPLSGSHVALEQSLILFKTIMRGMAADPRAVVLFVLLYNLPAMRCLGRAVDVVVFAPLAFR
jgi:hypothetical protein